MKKTQGVRVGNPKSRGKNLGQFLRFRFFQEGSPLVTLCCQILTKNPQRLNISKLPCANLCETQAEKTVKSTSTNLWRCINFSDPKVPKLLCITQRLVLLHLCFAVSLFQVGVCSETFPRAATAATVTVQTAATQPPGCNVEFGPLALRRDWKVDTRCRNSNASGGRWALGRSVAASHENRLLKTKGHHLGPWKKCEMCSFHGSWMGNLEKVVSNFTAKKNRFF